MRIESIFLLFLGAFFGIVGLVYWFWGYDDGGGVMLLGATLLGFLPGLVLLLLAPPFPRPQVLLLGQGARRRRSPV